MFFSAFMLSLANMLFADSPSENSEASQEHKILIGWASKSITPTKPVALSGQFHVRVSKYVQDPIMATSFVEDEKVSTVGGHLLEGCIVVGFAEVYIMELTEIEMVKRFDEETQTTQLFA